MTVSGAPTQIQSLADILGALSAWTATGSSAADIYWPSLDPADIGATPAAVIDQTGKHTATLRLYAANAYSEAALVDLANALARALPTRYRTDGTGVFISVDPEIGEVMEPTDAAEVGLGGDFFMLEIMLTIGINEE